MNDAPVRMGCEWAAQEPSDIVQKNFSNFVIADDQELLEMGDLEDPGPILDADRSVPSFSAGRTAD